MKLVFFQHCHNGDLFVSREFVKQIKTQLLDADLEYYHKNSPRVLLDLGITQKPLNQEFSIREKFIKFPEGLAINTWVGAYDPKITPEPPHYYSLGISLDVLYQIWGYIFSEINTGFQKNLILKNINEYLPEIDFEKFHVQKITEHVYKHTSKKILICNGEPKSKQSFRESFSDIIEALAEKLKNQEIICTEKFTTSRNNIYFTQDIIGLSGSDLAEISYLSQHCDLIIGRNSGPFVYCLTKTNLMNKNKTFISFNHTQEDQFPLGSDYLARYIFSNNYQKDNMLNLIIKNV